MILKSREHTRPPASSVSLCLCGKSLWLLERTSHLYRNVLASVSERLAHPDQFSEKLVHALLMRGAIQNVSSLVEEFLGAGKVTVPKDRDEPQLAQHRQQILDHAHPAKAASGHTAKAHRLVDVFL